jgi:hypothetical protein
MNYFSSDQLTGPKVREEFRCRCGAQPKLVRKMMDSHTGRTVRMFECQCGAKSWTEKP